MPLEGVLQGNFYDIELTLGLPAQAIGWPPVRSFRRKAIMEKCKYVKVGADGTPYLRKVGLDTYNGYGDLLKALEDMLICYIHCEGAKLMDSTRGMEYVPTYEDKDGDCMLVGDVPWKTFTESCKRIHLMKNSERAGLGQRCMY